MCYLEWYLFGAFQILAGMVPVCARKTAPRFIMMAYIYQVYKSKETFDLYTRFLDLIQKLE